ncbi:TonB-dependent receptor plug domain-containing protein [Mastigocoleus testarum]|uniref:TonB-dependent receptor n=1 Tax=Mastigocoleus testarum BC008 TaxID=371196 RepID=A0A0V7ZBS3_9CYAN|nr:TonB-dependent receptor [Mastigocoleus testarum]KST61970.1 TonB-dependent receptor [Mastigocoleus testarum BC008]
MKNITLNSQLGMQFFAIAITVNLGFLLGNDNATAQKILQLSEFSQYQGDAKDLKIIPKIVSPEVISENTSSNTDLSNTDLSNTEKVEDIAQKKPPTQEAEKEDREEADIELTVVGEILDQPVFTPFRSEGKVRDATRPVYVINREEIEAQGARTVKEALRFVPGILPDGTVGTEIGGLSGQFIRGSNTGQVLILLNGRPVNNLGSGGFDLSEITTDIVERVEVLPGGGSTLYGSDAIGGTINIITRRPTKDITTTTQLRLGSYNLNEQSIQTSGKQGNVSWLLGYNRTRANNNFDYSIPEVDFDGTRENADVLYNNLNLQVDAQLSDRQSLSFNTIYLAKDQGVPGGVAIPQISQAAFNSLTDNNRKYTDQVLTDLSWNAKLGKADDSLLTARVYLDFLNTRFDNRTGDISTHQQFDNNQRSLGFQIQHNWQITQNQNITYGFDYRNVSAKNITRNLADGTETENYDDSIGQGAVFAKYLVDVIPDVRLNFGLRQDFNSLINGSVTSPAIGARWNLGETTTLRGNYIRNFRVPTLFNLFSNSPFAQGNPDLKPERGDSFDIGIDQQLGDIGLIRFTFFSNTISDNIAFDFVNSTYENIGKVRTTGIELALNLQLARNLYFFGNYTANDPRILESSNPAEVDKELRFAGADSINLGLSYENAQGWYAGVLMRSLGRYPTNNTNTESLPGYTTFDFKLRVPVSKNLAFNGSIENILDRRFQLFPGFPDAGRIVQAGVNYKF